MSKMFWLVAAYVVTVLLDLAANAFGVSVPVVGALGETASELILEGIGLAILATVASE